jgi:hypothetical protein
MERRLGRVLDADLVAAYLKLDEDQLSTKRIGHTFSKAPPNISSIDYRPKILPIEVLLPSFFNGLTFFAMF